MLTKNNKEKLLYLNQVDNISGMNKEKENNQKPEKKEEKKKLSKERYDSKLFKQAYKAAKEAREIDKRRKKKESVLRVILFTTVPFVVVLLVFLIISLLPDRLEYIEARELGNGFESKISMEIEVQEPILNDISISSELSAQSVLVYDPKSGAILYEKDSLKERPVASLTKILSAIVVLENYNLEDILTVDLENIPEDLDWQLYLKQGDKITVENILKAMLISSYNDAAYIVANAYPYGGYEAFIKAMNSKAKRLRMYHSNFSNPAGIDDELNYSSAQDMAILVTVARNYEYISQLVRLSSDGIYWDSEGQLESKKIYTTNQLVGSSSYVRGFKTGNTKLAGGCFVGYFIYPNEQELVTVILGSEDRFTDTTILESYVRRNLLR